MLMSLAIKIGYSVESQEHIFLKEVDYLLSLVITSFVFLYQITSEELPVTVQCK